MEKLQNVEAIRIEPAAGLDTIDVYFWNGEPGQGQVTITCWGNAWTAYFGGMSGQRIQEFIQTADVNYLVNKMGCSQILKPSAKNNKYLGRIIDAVKEALK